MTHKPYALTLDAGTSLANHTGNWRDDRPVYIDRLPPCNTACPAGEDIQGWLYLAEEGDYQGAWRRLVEQNPFPAVMGRVCYRPCEEECNRRLVDEAVGINSVERFLGDEAVRRSWELPGPGPDTGKQVLIVGAGPCGLSAAYHLRRLGHQVTIMDGDRRPGGMMQAGIPAYRLPRNVLSAEIDRVLGLGIDLRLGTRVENLELARNAGGFDAALVAVGAQVSHHTEIPAGDSARVLEALGLLRSVAAGSPVKLGRTVAVYGGGDTAFDAARTAKRLGATDAIVIYRRSQNEMPAHDVELNEAEAEGIQIRWLRTIRRASDGDLLLEQMSLDAEGFPQPTGQFEHLATDDLVLALGQETDLSLVDGLLDVATSDGVIQVDPDLMTGHPGIFAGGDASPGERSVTKAVGHGARAARHIDDWLAGIPSPEPAERPPVRFEHLNLWYYADAPRTVRPELDAARRQAVFDEVVGGLTEENALFEARRCMSCGNCLECDNCYAVCPDNAVIKLGPGQRYAIDYDYCKGCGICAKECPCGAIVMQPEQA